MPYEILPKNCTGRILSSLVHFDPRKWMSHRSRHAQATEEREYPTVRLNGVAHSSGDLEALLQAEPITVAASNTTVRAVKRPFATCHGPLRKRIAISTPSARPSMWQGRSTNWRYGL